MGWFAPFNAVITSMEVLNRSRSIFFGIEESRKVFPDSVVTAIMMGTVFGFGGSLVFNALEKFTIGWNTAPKSELSMPAWNFRASLYSSIAFVVLTDLFHMFPGHPFLVDPQDLKFALLLLAIPQALLAEVFNWRCVAGPFYFPEQLVLTALRIVEPVPADHASSIPAVKPEPEFPLAPKTKLQQSFLAPKQQQQPNSQQHQSKNVASKSSHKGRP